MFLSAKEKELLNQKKLEVEKVERLESLENDILELLEDKPRSTDSGMASALRFVFKYTVRDKINSMVHDEVASELAFRKTKKKT